MTEPAETDAQHQNEPLDDVDAAERLPAEIEPAILHWRTDYLEGDDGSAVVDCGALRCAARMRNITCAQAMVPRVPSVPR